MTIPELIEATKLTNAQIAAKLSVDGLTVYRWRKGVHPPHPGYRRALCKLAGVCVDDVSWERDAISATSKQQQVKP